MKTNRSVIVQCRLSSTRLPGKALKILGNKPVLAWVLEAMKKVPADSYFVATDKDSYALLKPVCDKYNFNCFAGDLNDVLKRFCDLIKQNDVKTVIRATADNPFLFYEAAEDTVKLFEEKNKTGHCDYLTISGLPHGSGVEVFSGESLLKAAEETDSPYDHEHVGPALYNHKDKYVCEFVPAPDCYNYPKLRTTIDTYSDYLRAIKISDYLGVENAPYSCNQIIEACNSDTVKNPVILMPSVEKGHGTGHLHRCLQSALKNNWFVFVPENRTLSETDSLISDYEKQGLKNSAIITEFPDESYSPVVIADTFCISKEQLEFIKTAKTVISVDDGSDFNEYCDYVLDVIPSINSKHYTNLTEPDFINKPLNKHKTPVTIDKLSKGKVLVCFGGEDPAGFTLQSAAVVRELFNGADITVIVSDKNREGAEEQLKGKNINISGPVSNLKEKLYEYDLVVTHYGLTAFEAQSAGCGVILLPTTELHLQLAKKYNFAYAQACSVSSFGKALTSVNLIKSAEENDDSKDLSDYYKKLAAGVKINCPVCNKKGEKPDSIVARNSSKTYRRCNCCGMIYLSWSKEPEKKYEKSYFFDEYQKQYGKTYTEDFDSIKKQCINRLCSLKAIAGKLEGMTCLDVGCAYGPFLSAAKDFNMKPYGTDISDDAVEYVKNELHLPAAPSPFPEIDTTQKFGRENFDLVTMWYVIEHFKNLDQVLNKVSSLVKTNGYFAFSTPSGQGVSATTNKENFFIQSPGDHYTVWEPSKAQKILAKYGFKVVKIVSTGHHPERFPGLRGKNINKASLKWKLTMKKSQFKKLGDTVEIYCKKVGK